jgi:hypothetical protein
MPLTHHFTSSPSPTERRVEHELQPSQHEQPASSYSCQKQTGRCNQCRQRVREAKSVVGEYSQTTLSSIKEEMDPRNRSLTPKAIRDQRRALGRTMSVSAVFGEAVGTEDYFTFYHATAFARSPAASTELTHRERSSRRVGSAFGGQPRKSSAEQTCLPSVPDLAPVHSRESGIEGGQELPRRDS